jgi:hypothetical protein
MTNIVSILKEALKKDGWEFDGYDLTHRQIKWEIDCNGISTRDFGYDVYRFNLLEYFQLRKVIRGKIKECVGRVLEGIK